MEVWYRCVLQVCTRGGLVGFWLSLFPLELVTNHSNKICSSIAG